MGAGISQQDMNRRFYSALKHIQRELAEAGVPVTYRRLSLYHADPFAGDDFNITFKTLRASNGEAAGILNVRVTVEDKLSVYNMNSVVGNAQMGIDRIKALWGFQ